MKRFLSVFGKGLGIHGLISDTTYRGLNKAGAKAFTVVFVVVVVVGAYISASWSDAEVIISGRSSTKPLLHPLICSSDNQTQTCPPKRPIPTVQILDDVKSPSCPDYFRWIHEDLRPWKATGISKEMVERAKGAANFRLVVLNGTAYVEKFRAAIQTRDVFTLWGILQLLRLYPGRVPDLELMFDCFDRPIVKSRDYRGRNSSGPPPLFRYCGDKDTLDIVFPDWSFWGWAEINISPWHLLLKNIKEGNERIKWMDREPYAYWKGNPSVAAPRRDLLKCNVSETQDWNARLYVQDWISESQQGFKQSDLANQCTHRYKIYIEGYAWSVSEKYILACNSPTLIVKPQYYDFFVRGLMPMQHYWPIRGDKKCQSIKFAVDWGNDKKEKAQDMGNAASSFIQEELKMDYVYDYMFHLLNEYAKLLRYKPTKPKNAVELCLESMACPAKGLEKKFMVESMVKAPKESSPCTLPPPFRPSALRGLLKKKEDSIKQVEVWEKGHWRAKTARFRFCFLMERRGCNLVKVISCNKKTM
ncbi:O-glucosyltransferase rumi-like protein [Cinnamomum micranthum f. kanehirae]|uniref:O-glucosyltransferase rumi-like protein n=1 Tax=Cinnamomum micranthum f. kanehirae TaxID=337451 RepID=A0A3S4PL52_9MAGN|nr:O-glucosyltransferase rumi-like protein [Cinnamomum micranthum f. kanehirae]